jgi:hypothetical protein
MDGAIIEFDNLDTHYLVFASAIAITLARYVIA